MNKVKGYRNMIELTQANLAEKLGISREALNRKEQNDSFTKTEKLAMTKIFNDAGLLIKFSDIFLE